jgi:hypothetical protein
LPPDNFQELPPVVNRTSPTNIGRRVRQSSAYDFGYISRGSLMNTANTFRTMDLLERHRTILELV